MDADRLRALLPLLLVMLAVAAVVASALALARWTAAPTPPFPRPEFPPLLPMVPQEDVGAASPPMSELPAVLAPLRPIGAAPPRMYPDRRTPPVPPTYSDETLARLRTAAEEGMGRDPAAVAAALRAAGALNVRVAGPGQAMTKDYSPGRVNVHHDGRGVTGVDTESWPGFELREGRSPVTKHVIA